jgi:glycosyltransferase involved in cell wall biosynthesis
MNVLMVTGSLPEVRCGIGAYAGRLASALATTHGVRVQVLTTTNALVRPELIQPAELLPTVDGWSIFGVLKAMRRARGLRPDIVHFQYPAVGYARSLGVLLLPAIARRVLRVPVVTTVHEWRVRRWHGRLATDLVAATSDLVIVPDRLEAEELAHHLRRTRVEFAEMISTIPTASSADRASARAQFRLPRGALVIGTFGLVQPRHRLEDIVDAQAELRRRGVESHFLIIGGEAEYDAAAAHRYIEDVRSRIEELGLGERVTWTGYVPDEQVSRALRACDVCVLIYPEGVSARNTTLQAALEHGLPVVTTDGPATGPELREMSAVHLLPASGYQAGDLADAILDAARRSGGAPAASRLARSVEWHLKRYRELISAVSSR